MDFTAYNTLLHRCFVKAWLTNRTCTAVLIIFCSSRQYAIEYLYLFSPSVFKLAFVTGRTKINIPPARILQRNASFYRNTLLCEVAARVDNRV